jgi:very-short-patch-repair endonuclease
MSDTHDGFDPPRPKSNPPKTKRQRRNLRTEQTKSEAKLWSKLRNRQLVGCKFRRQHPVDQYILDFYCPELRLAIEIDGDSHFIGLAPVRDKEREQYLTRYGIRMLRFTNEDVRTNLDSVIQAIFHEVQMLQNK